MIKVVSSRDNNKVMISLQDKVMVLFSGREMPKAVSGQEIDENFVFELLLFFIIRTLNWL